MAATAAASPAPVEETLAWEAQQGPRAGAAAIAAGVATLAGTILTVVSLRGAPGITLADGLHAAGHPTEQRGPLEKKLIFLHDHIATLTLAQVVSALAAPLLALALIYLFRATRARKTDLRQASVIALVVGAALTCVGLLVYQITIDVLSSNYISGSDHSTRAAEKAIQSPTASLGFLVGNRFGPLVLGLAVVLISLNAMRVGLLTRFLGVLGIMSGVITPLIGLPIVQAFWLVALGILFLRRMPSGTPPAWETGRAEPWPTRQEMLEQQGKARPAGTRGAPPKAPKLPPPADPVDTAPERSEHPRSKKKKRRR